MIRSADYTGAGARRCRNAYSGGLVRWMQTKGSPATAQSKGTFTEHDPLLPSDQKSGVVLPAPSDVKRIGWPPATCLMRKIRSTLPSRPRSEE